jgi:hypothetical protein
MIIGMMRAATQPAPKLLHGEKAQANAPKRFVSSETNAKEKE